MKPSKKLIEVALPLEAINKASAREKSIRHGHPSTLHLWWARRPLAAARAVIFAQMVDDPSAYVDVLRQDAKLRHKAEKLLDARKKLWAEAKRFADLAARAKTSAPAPGPEPTLDEILAELERERLFKIIEDLVLWENTTNETVLQAARDEIWQSWRRACAQNADHPRAKELFDRTKLPAFHDPFAGGGALPLEAQRLGLEAYASDLNPVAVLICKAMIEIPPKFAGKPPVNPEARKDKQLISKEWRGAQGLAEDVRYYGQWMRDEAEKRIGHLYPKIEVTAEMAQDPNNPRPDLRPYVGKSLTVIAWLWARTVRSPNPAFEHVEVPLISNYVLSAMTGKEAYLAPIIEMDGYRFAVKAGKPKDFETAKNGTKLSRGANFRCLVSGTPMTQDHIRGEFKAKRDSRRLMAIVAEGERGRVYLSPSLEHEAIARSAQLGWYPEQEMSQESSNLVSGRGYGIAYWHEIFTRRQLASLGTFSDLAQEARERVRLDAIAAGMPEVEQNMNAGCQGSKAYADSVAIYLGLALSRFADRNNALCTWDCGPVGTRSSTGGSARTATVSHLFTRQAIPMAWDHAEANPFSNSGGSYSSSFAWIVPAVAQLAGRIPANSQAADASKQHISRDKIVSTDPPYYDNIGYADLSDFFYIWLRRSLKSIFPELFTTLVAPKSEELVATPFRHGGKEKAEAFFLDGMTQAMHRLAEQAHAGFPVTIYYAFKQSERAGDKGTSSTGWETFLDAVIRAGFAITGTWPMRTELSNRMIGIGTNALASSIVLVCRPATNDAKSTTRREFVAALKAELPAALAHLQRGNIAPVDLAQAAIGPGMAVYTRFAKVLDAEGKPLSVRDALALINQTLDEALAEQEGDFDADSRWAVAWFEQAGFAEGDYGVAEVLSKAKNTSLAGMVEAGILVSSRGKVRLLKPSELPADWDPTKDVHRNDWEVVHHLIRALEKDAEPAAASIVSKLGPKAEIARELCYRLYTLCERKKRAAEALSYNGLVQSWPEIMRLASGGEKPRAAQTTMFEENDE